MSAPNKPNRFIILLAIIALLGGVLVQQFSQQYVRTQKTMPASLVVGDPLSTFNLPDLTDKQHAISQWQDKIRIINFWATWCSSCLIEMPEFIKLQNEWGHKGLQFIGIAVEDKQTVATYLHTHPVNYPILIAGDEGMALSRRLGNRYGTIPFTLIVNQYGYIIAKRHGTISRENILSIIKPFMQNKQ